MTNYSPQAERLLDAAAEMLLAHKLDDMSLRTMASRLGTSHRMLIYHFGSKEGFQQALLRRLRTRQQLQFRDAREMGDGAAGQLKRSWEAVSSEGLRSQFKLLFDVYGAAIRDPERFRPFLDEVVDEWLPFLEQWFDEQFPNLEGRTKAAARLQLAVTRGLLLDLLTTDDRQATNDAMELYAELLTTFDS